MSEVAWHERARLDQDRAVLRSLVKQAGSYWLDYIRKHFDDAQEGVLPDEVALRVIEDLSAQVPPRLAALAVAELAVRGYGVESFAQMADELHHIRDWMP